MHLLILRGAVTGQSAGRPAWRAIKTVVSEERAVGVSLAQASGERDEQAVSVKDSAQHGTGLDYTPPGSIAHVGEQCSGKLHFSSGDFHT